MSLITWATLIPLWAWCLLLLVGVGANVFFIHELRKPKP